MKKPAKLVRRHLCEKLWTFCQNSNKFATNHTFIEQIDHIEGRNIKISYDLLLIYTFWSLSSPKLS